MDPSLRQSRVWPSRPHHAHRREPWVRARSRLARLILLVAFTIPWFSVAISADAVRWTDRTAPIFHVVANQSGDDAAAPYTGNPGALAQDQSGFIWIGTDVGLERWDGYRVRTYAAHAGDPCALPADYVVTLYVDARGRLWISTFGGGLAYYEPRTDCIHTVGSANDLIRAPADSIASDEAGGLWLGTTDGLLYLSADLKNLSRLPEDASAQGHLSHERIACVLRDRQGVLWVGSGRGLERRAPTQRGFEPVALPAGAKVATLFESSDGRIWAGTTADGAYVVEPSTARVRAIDEIQQRKPIPLIWRAAETSTGEIWLGTTSAGIIRVDPVSLRSRALRHEKGLVTGLPEDAVVDLMRDSRGLLWVASDSGFGFFNLRNDVSTILSGDELNDVSEGLVKAVVHMGDGRIAIDAGTAIALLGPRGTGAERVPFDPLPPPASLAALATLNGRDLFAAASPYGLVWLDRSTRRSSLVALPGPNTSRHILALLPDDGRLWAGGTEGLWVVEGRADNRAALSPWLGSRRFELRDVCEIAMGQSDVRWVGTVKGLYRLTLSSTEPTPIQLESLAGDLMADPYIKSLHTDHQGHLWIGTNSDGLYVVDPTKGPDGRARVLRHLTTELPSGTVSKILEDGFGAVWVSTDRGIARIDANSFAVSRLTRGDGIVISSHLSGSCADELCNELMFGGLNGITLIRPDRRAQARESLTVVITRISVGRELVPSSRFNSGAADLVLEIPADAHNMAVEFAALDYSDPMHNRYEYRLDGYDRDWVPTAADVRMATYMNLAPGVYHLRVRGTDHTGIWSPRERQIMVRVAAAWYQTMWFHVLEVLAVLMALMLIVQASTVVLRARQRELESLVDEKTQALVGATGERNALIEILAHDLRTPLTSLRGYLDRLSQNDAALTESDRDRFVGIATRQAERLTRLVHELFELVRLDDPLARLILEEFSPAEIVQDVVQELASIAEGQHIDCALDRGVESVRIVGDISLFQRLIDNLVVNAVRHTPPGGKVTIRLAADESVIVLEVRDTGRGIERTDLDRIFNRYERGDNTGRIYGAGLGLAIVKRILDLHGGSIVVDSDLGRGTRFTVRLPREAPAAQHS
jgi:signal transduction histidine kinase/ligand-binding sensor domain-containing protein